MSNFIPTNLQTGYNNEINCLERAEIEVNVTSSVMAFVDYAIKTASVYATHAERKNISVNDLKKALMLEVFHYFNHDDLEEKVVNWRQIILQDMQETEEEDEDYEEEEYEDDEKETVSTCKCELCESINSIEEKWESYHPTDDLGKILKTHIDNMC